MRWPALLLAVLLAFVGTSARDTAADQPGSGIDAPVSAVHVHTTGSPDACWALVGASGDARPPAAPPSAEVACAESVDETSAGQWSSRAPPFAAIA
ncbi:hypothetical protein [Lentzea sp. NBRC 102530]|uniref:hypothetical protein n=1 Tax=Lentzea sp. NBRC 102530 TaxID=3032201 RepID=UPI0024A5346C|nr:hypothetical protein [Lentzea sp. NBRC 102530]GLY47293.1 hypothetical protein Lesp01_09490 [Lentzea sp. NBRC 102530]